MNMSLLVVDDDLPLRKIIKIDGKRDLMLNQLSLSH